MINRFLRKIKYWYKSDNESFIKYLRKKGITIGNNVHFYGCDQAHIDLQYPFLINIGDNVVFAPGCRLITHDFSWFTLKCKFGQVMGASGQISIGENTFIGSDVTILRNSIIGKNCVIGAGSLVSGVIPSDSVAVGRPAKVIMSIDEYFNKRQKKQLDEAVQLFQLYFNKYKKVPPQKIFKEYFWLFSNKTDSLNTEERRLLLGVNESQTVYKFTNHRCLFKSFSVFCEYCLKLSNEDVKR